MSKSPDAFRTISEVAEWLDTPAHVLRFWESKFTQVKPVKRAGGRRYYRPADMELIGGIKKLLHDDGMTIKGVQKMLREQGVRKVAVLSQPVDETGEIEAAPFHEMAEAEDTVVPFGNPSAEASVPNSSDAPENPEPAAHESMQTPPAAPEITAAPLEQSTEELEPALDNAEQDPVPEKTTAYDVTEEPIKADAEEMRPPALQEPPETMAEDDPERLPVEETDDLPDFLTSPTFPDQVAEQAETTAEPDQPDDGQQPVEEDPQDALVHEEPEAEQATAPDPEPPTPKPAPTPFPAVFGAVPADADIKAPPGALSHLSRIRSLSPENAEKIALAAEQLRAFNQRLSRQ